MSTRRARMRAVVAVALSVLAGCHCSASVPDPSPTLDTGSTTTADTATETVCGEPFSDQCIYRESGDCLDPVYFRNGGVTPDLDLTLEAMVNLDENHDGDFCAVGTARSCPVPGHAVLAFLEYDSWVAYVYDDSGEEVGWLWECNEDCPPGPCVTVFLGDPALEDCARKAMTEIRQRAYAEPFACGEFLLPGAAECPEHCVQIEEGLL